MILTSQCEFCKYGSVNDMDKARVQVHCVIKQKTYYYGMCIPCENYEKKEKEKKELWQEQ